MPKLDIKRTEVLPAQCIPLQRLPANMEAAPRIQDNIFPPSICYGVPIDDDRLLAFASLNRYVSPSLPQSDSEEDSDEAAEKLAAKGWEEVEKSQQPDPELHLRAFCNQLLYEKHYLTIQMVWDVEQKGDGEGGMIAIPILSFYSNYMPKEERILPDLDLELSAKGAKPMWYYRVKRSFLGGGDVMLTCCPLFPYVLPSVSCNAKVSF